MRTYWLCIFFALCTIPAFAQNPSGSPYSYFGIGDLTRYRTTYSLGLAGTGIAVQSADQVIDQNPASYNSIKPATFLFSLGSLGSYINQRTSHEQSSQFDYSFSSFSLWLRFKKNWAGNIGIAPYSKIGYDLVSSSSSSGLSDDYNITYQGSGGLYQLYFGNAFEVAKNLSLGIRLSYFFGPMDRIRSLTIGQSNTQIRIEENTFANAFNSDYGIQYTFNRMRTKYTIGAVFGHKSVLQGNNKTVVANLNDSEVLEESETSLEGYLIPMKAGSGFSVSVRERFMFCADVLYEQWSQASFDNAASDVFRYSAGCEIKIGSNNTGKKKSFTLPIRLGYYYEQSYIQLRNYRPNTMGFSLGCGIPIAKLSIINLAYAFSTRGKATQYLIEENSHTISIDVLLRDIWFKRNKYN